jgi:hypothetical protein
MTGTFAYININSEHIFDSEVFKYLAYIGPGTVAANIIQPAISKISRHRAMFIVIPVIWLVFSKWSGYSVYWRCNVVSVAPPPESFVANIGAT